MSPPRPTLPVALLLAACLAACPRPTQRLGDKSAVELLDTLPGLRDAVRAPGASARTAAEAYAQRHRELFEAARVTPEVDRLILRATEEALGAFERDAGPELNAVVNDLTRRLGRAPRVTVAFAAIGSRRPVVRGTFHGQTLLLFDAVDEAMGSASQRRVAFARALFGALQADREGVAPPLPPLAARVFQVGAEALAARLLVPDALEHQLLGLSAAQLNALRGREGPLARELLAGLDSAREAEAVRFFDPTNRDPLVPPGAGPFLADRLFQRFAAEATPTQALWLPASEFPSRARRVLAGMR